MYKYINIYVYIYIYVYTILSFFLMKYTILEDRLMFLKDAETEFTSGGRDPRGLGLRAHRTREPDGGGPPTPYHSERVSLRA